MTTRGLNLHSPARERGGESHRLASELTRVAGVQETNPKEVSQEARSTLPWAPGPSAQMAVLSPSADLSREF